MTSELDFKTIRVKVIPVWSLALQRLGSSYTETLQNIIDWVCEYPSTLNAMLRGEATSPSAKSTKSFLKPLLAHLSNDRNEIEKWLTALRQIIQAGNELSTWSFPLPAITIRAQREKGRFNPERFHNRVLADKWRETLFASFNDQTIHDAQYHLGQVLLSAILCGGLINTQLLIAFTKVISEKPKYHIKKRYFDLTPTWQGHEEVEFRRWFPDIITESLLLRFSHLIGDSDLIPEKPSGKWLLNAIYRFLRDRKLPKDLCPNSVSSLMDFSLIRYELNLAPFIADYSARRYLSHSLRASAWNRLKNIPTSIDDEQLERELKLTSWERYPAVEYEADSDKTDIQGDYFSELRSLLKEDHIEPTRKKLKEYLTNHQHNDGELLFLITKWFISLLNPASGGKSVQTSTLRNYLSTIGKRLYEVFPDMDLRHLSTEEIEEKYQLILDDIDSKGLRRKVAKALYQFHQYISDHFQIAEIDYHAVLGAFSAPAPVDANILWVDEYIETLELIKSSDLIQMHPDMVEVAQLILMLGYRCGLRRMEALKLRIIDVVGNVEPELLIRPFDERRLKTTNSKRKIPLYALLNEQELKQLLDWRDKRQNEEAAKAFSGYLFSVPELNYTCVSEDLIFPILHSAMRTTTGDQSIRFHHLRHSFGSLTLLRLMAAENNVVPQGLFDRLPQQLHELKDSKSLRTKLLPILGPTRKYLYAVARLLGHSGPDISLEHYIHILDILLHHQISQQSIDRTILVAVSGLPKTTAYRQLENGEESLLECLRKKNRQLPEKEKRPKQSAQKAYIDKSDIEKSVLKDFEATWEILYLHSAFNLSVEQLAERYQRSVNEVFQLIESAKRLQAEQSAGPHPAPKFKMQKKRLQDGTEIQLLCPSQPRTAEDKALAEQQILGAHKLKLENPDLYHAGLALYHKHVWRTRYHAVFKSHESKDAQRFLDFLKGIGLTKEQVELSLLHGQKASDTWIKNSLSYWKRSITKSHQYVWKVRASTDGETMGSYGWLGLNVLNNLCNEASASIRYAIAVTLTNTSIDN